MGRERRTRRLLADAEPAEDAVEDVVGDDRADDLAQLVERPAAGRWRPARRRRPGARVCGGGLEGLAGAGRGFAAARGGAGGQVAVGGLRRGGRRRWRGRSASRPAPVAALVGQDGRGGRRRRREVGTWSRRAAGGGRRDRAGRRRVGSADAAVEQQVGAVGLAARKAWAWRSIASRPARARRCRSARRSGRRSRRGPRGSRGSCPARGETSARSRPSRALNSRLLPALGGPTRTTRGCPPGRSRPRSRSARAASSAADLGQARGQRGAAERVDVGLVDEVEVGLEVGEDIEQAVAERGDRPGQAAGQLLEAASSCAGVWASMTPSTASARVRSIRPERNARSVNSPGSASRAPRARQWARTSSSSGGEPTVWISASGWPV